MKVMPGMVKGKIVYKKTPGKASGNFFFFKNNKILSRLP